MEWLDVNDNRPCINHQRCIFCICGTEYVKIGFVECVGNDNFWYEEVDEEPKLATYRPTHWYPLEDIPESNRISRFVLKGQENDESRVAKA